MKGMSNRVALWIDNAAEHVRKSDVFAPQFTALDAVLVAFTLVVTHLK